MVRNQKPNNIPTWGTREPGHMRHKELMSLVAYTILLAAQGPAAAKPAQLPFSVLSLRTSPGIRALAVAPAPTGSKIVVSTEDKSVHIVDAATGVKVRSLVGHPQPCNAVAWSPNGKYIATGDESARIWIWDAASGKKLRELERKHLRGIQALSFNATSSMVMSTGNDDSVRVFDLSDGKEKKYFLGKGSNLYGAKYLPGGGTMWATLGSGVKYSMGKTMFTFNVPDNQGYWDAAYVPQSNVVLTAARDGRVGVWSTKTGQRTQFLNGHADWVVRLSITPNGRYAASSSTDMTVRVWDLKTYKQAAVLNDQSAVAAPITFTADGKYLVSCTSSGFMQVSTVTPTQMGAVKPKK